jgi:energy-coupling factor transport system ATP-binding protein
MIRLRDVSVVHAGRQGPVVRALDGVALDLERGERVALLGANGSGKSTLLTLLAGALAPTSGTVAYPGGERPRAALLLQEPENQLVAATVRDELALSTPEASDASAARARVNEAIARFDLAHLLDRHPHALSGGEQQRVALATVWLAAPKLLLLDEPAAHLDAEHAARCVAFVVEMARDGTAVVWATPGGADLAHAPRTVGLCEGRRVFDGATESVYAWAEAGGFAFDPPPLRALARVLSDRLGMGDLVARAGAGVDALADALAGTVEATRGEEAGATAGGEAVVDLDGVGFAYGAREVLHGVDLVLSAGEVVGLAGANAAGKTTLLLLAAGALAPSAGRVRRPRRAGKEARAFYMPQSPERLFFAESVREEIAFGLERRGVARAEAARRAADTLRAVGLEPAQFAERFPFHLSLGEMRRVAFAIAGALAPDLLLLDEPTSCLDREGVDALRARVAEARAHGAAVAVASHDVAFLCETCDRVLFLREGTVETEIDTAGGQVGARAVWPAGRTPLVVALQDALAARGVRVEPRALTVERLAERLVPRR